MADAARRVVLDTNVVVRGIVNAGSPSGMILTLCDQRKIVPLLSGPVLAEYRATLSDPAITSRYPELDWAKIEKVLARLHYIGDVFRPVKVRFRFPRDPKDARFIELAIAGNASDIITCDRDLLDLPAGQDEASRRFRQRLPRVSVISPEQFLRWIDRQRMNPN